MNVVGGIVGAVAVLLVASGAFASVPGDKIDSLPGWDKSLPSDFYSGYFGVGNGKFLHYMLVESENDPSNDPVVFWFNGGPGCSSLDGFFYEMGPLHIVEPINKNNPQLYLNEYRWSLEANMVFLEAPAGVGYSYANDPKTGYVTNDTQTAEDNLAAVLKFFEAYPEYSKNKMFIAGESYAGAYVPMLALQVLAHNKAGEGLNVNLQGIMVGNGVIGIGAIDDNTSMKVYSKFYGGHALASSTIYEQLLDECDNFQNTSSSACQKTFQQMTDAIGNVNIYDIYEPCINSGFPPSEKKFSRRPVTKLEQSIGGPEECIDAGAATFYLNLDNVRDALHVKSAASIGNWSICSGKIDYHVTQHSLMPAYNTTIIPAIRVLIFNGDVDACVPYTENEWWTSNLNREVSSAWRAWNVNNQVAGYVVEYGPNFQFATVKGSGHMVPQYRPSQALQMFHRFINNMVL
eukprot:m.136129 g.136129  ORF g.136129 m.136129 type:complete len:460 (-) comp10451_c0_seq1:126-1505(-)